MFVTLPSVIHVTNQLLALEPSHFHTPLNHWPPQKKWYNSKSHWLSISLWLTRDATMKQSGSSGWMFLARSQTHKRVLNPTSLTAWWFRNVMSTSSHGGNVSFFAEFMENLFRVSFFHAVSSITGDFWEIWEASTVGLGWQNPSPNLSKEKLWVVQTWFQWHGHRPRISPGSRAHLPPASILCLDLFGSRSLKEGYSFGRIAILPEMFAS